LSFAIRDDAEAEESNAKLALALLALAPLKRSKRKKSKRGKGFNKWRYHCNRLLAHAKKGQLIRLILYPAPETHPDLSKGFWQQGWEAATRAISTNFNWILHKHPPSWHSCSW
jgi:hypothetical protein